jgi:hypothetical protein
MFFFQLLVTLLGFGESTALFAQGLFEIANPLLKTQRNASRRRLGHSIGCRRFRAGGVRFEKRGLGSADALRRRN